jgi:hypothetical protein
MGLEHAGMSGPSLPFAPDKHMVHRHTILATRERTRPHGQAIQILAIRIHAVRIHAIRIHSVRIEEK